MKQNRLSFLVVSIAAFLAASQVCAQTSVDGQPSVLKEDKGQSNYVYDLKLLIKKSKDNIKGVNEKIKEQAVIKRNQQREEKAREYYQQALKLQEEGRLEESRLLFDKAIRITEHPEMQYYIKESERRSKLQQAALDREASDQERRENEDQRLLMERAETAYQTAISLYKQQKFREAKDEFALIEEMYPDYKAVRSYLQIIEQDIIQSEHLNMKEQRNEISRQQKEEEIARLREKELWRKEVDKKEQERQAQLRKQADVVYEEAIRLFDERKYAAARDKFQEVEWVVPDHKSTRAYLARIESGIQDEKKQTVLQQQRELEKQRWQEALNEKKMAEDRRKAMEQREQEKLSEVKDQAEFVYVAAVALFEKELLEQAREKFNEVEKIYPNYKSTRDYLKRIIQASGQKIEREMLRKKSDEERRLWEEEMARRKEEKEKFKLLAGEADILYQDAVALYQTGRLIEAKDKFLEVDQRVPDYKSARVYLKRIDEDIELLVKTQRAQDSLEAQRQEIENMRILRDKAEGVYFQAVTAYDVKDFTLAKQKFEETEAIYPNYKKTQFYLNRIDEDVRLQQEAAMRAARDKEVAMAYAEALAFYEAGQFQDAKKKFIVVEAMVPDYKQTADFLGRIDDDILRKKESDLARMKEERVKGIYAQAQALYQSGEFSDAKQKFLEVEVIYPGYKDAARILSTLDAEIEKKRKELMARQGMEVAEKFYSEAMALYQLGDYAGAKEKFIKTEVASPDYKEALKYLARIDADIERKKKEDDQRIKEQEADPLYAQALGLYKDGDFVEAKKKFIAVQALCPGYKDTGIYFKRIDKDIRDQEERLARQEAARKADALYSDALKLYMDRQFVDAKTRFLDLVAIDPAYKNVRMYLSRIDDDIRDEAARKERAALEARVAEPYAQAVTLYHDGDLQAAKMKFLEVSRLLPDHKKTKSYLSRIDQDIIARKAEEGRVRTAKAESLYKEAIDLMARDKYIEAYAKFLDVEAVYPDYKGVRANLEKTRNGGVKQGAVLPQPGSSAPVVMSEEQQAASLYKEAVQLYKDKKYDAALEKFTSVEKLKPRYRSAQQYVQSIQEIKNPGAKVEKGSEEKKFEQADQVAASKKAAEVRQADAAKKAEEARQAAEARKAHAAKKAEEARKAAETRKADAAKKAEETRKAAEARKADAAKKAEEARKAAEAKKTEAAKKAEEVKKTTGTGKAQAAQKPQQARTERRAKKPGSSRKVEEGKKAGTGDGLVPAAEEPKEKTPVADKPVQVEAPLPEVKADLEGASLKKPETAPPAPPEKKVSPEALREEAKALAAISARSNELYRQIKALSEEKELSTTARTFAKVDRLIGDLEAEHRRIAERIVRQKKEEEAAVLKLKQKEKEEAQRQKAMLLEQAQALQKKAEGAAAEEARDRAAQLAREQEENRKKEAQELERLKDEQREAQLKAEVLYQQALEFFRQKNFSQARERLTEVGKIAADYKDTVKLMVRIDRAEDEAGVVAEEDKDKKEVQALAEKAALINVGLLELSEKKDYQTLEARFNDLESVLKEIKIIKSRMADRREKFTVRWEEKMAEQQASAKKRMSPKSSKDDDGLSPAQKARVLFKEGQQLYGAQNFAEARVKFMDAVRQDPTLKAALTYAQRIDRILSKRDFEVQEERQKMKQRDLVREGQPSAGAEAALPGADKVPPQVPDIQRAAQVSIDGIDLYKAKRYREARIKFEELLQVGNPDDQQKAARYLSLIEQALDKEKKLTDAEARAQEERFLEERRAQARLAWERDKRQQEREMRKTRELAATQREMDIRRQQQLREIEEENFRQRREMLERKSRALAKALHDDDAERAKFLGEPRREKAPADVKTAEEKAIEQKIEAARSEDAALAVTDKAIEGVAQDLSVDHPNRADRMISRQDTREKAATEAKVQKQRRRIDQLESKEQRQRRLDQEKKARQAEEAAAKAKKSVASPLKDKKLDEGRGALVVPSMQELEAQKKRREQQEIIRRNRAEVEALLKDVPAVSALPAAPDQIPVAPPSKVIPQTPAAIQQEDPESMLLKQAAEQEKVLLEQQRAAIRRDFEDGVERLYNEAVVLFKKRLYQEARLDFRQVDRLVPGYKKTAQYLQEIDGHLSR